MLDFYLITKVAHLFFIIAWMVGLLYLPRLYVYHCEAKAGGELDETLKVMERRLLKGIMTPSMLVTWVLGILLVVQNPSLAASAWFPAKAVCVVLISAAHMFYAKCRKEFEAGTNSRSQKFYRLINEVPAVLLILVLVLVVLKPF